MLPRSTPSTFILLTALLSIASQTAVAQGSPALDSQARAGLINAAADSLINGYIYQETGRTLADSLRGGLRAGSFDHAATVGALAEQVTEMLRRISHDRHLGVMEARPDLGAGGQPGIIRRRVPASGGSEQASGLPGSEYGFERVEVLAGNIGYIDLRGFSGEASALRYADSVMTSLAGVKALIIDLGRNGGGGPQMVQLLSAYLFDKPTHLVDTYIRGMPAPAERWTTEGVTGGPLAAIPVYILTSRRTFSAAESFTFGLKVNHRVTVVGERTGGGGHFGDFIPLIEGFTMFLPRGRTYDPRTNAGWEATGIEPDVAVPYEQSLERALAMVGERPQP